MKLKARNGSVFSFNKIFKNDNMISFDMNLLDFGFGIRHYIGDSRRFLTINFLFFILEVWY